MFLSPNINVIVYRIQPQEINMNENKRNKEEKTDHTMNPKKPKSDSIMDLVIQNHFKELKEEEDKIFQCRKGEFSNSLTYSIVNGKLLEDTLTLEKCLVCYELQLFYE
jgi:hypothetical protein